MSIIPTDTLIYRPASYVEQLKIGELFPKDQPLEVELGSGDGSFLSRFAQLNSERNFMGVERLLGRLRKVDRKTRRLGLQNVRLIRLEASYVIEYLLPKASVRALHVYFPDPWPKRKHRKNRLIDARFVQIASRIMEPGGRVYLRTDDADYFEQMTSSFSADTSYSEVATPPELLAVVTDFERVFHERGVPTLHKGYQFR